MESELFSDFCFNSAAATANLGSRVPCWAVASSNGRTSGCKVRATKGFFCGRHCGVNGLQDHLNSAEDPYRDCSSACFTCGENFSADDAALRCCICVRSVHCRCLAEKLKGRGIDISTLNSQQVACEACYLFREADLCVFQSARLPELVEVPETVAERAKVAVASMVYFPLHLALCAPLMKEALISQRRSLGYTYQGQTPQTGVIKLKEYLPAGAADSVTEETVPPPAKNLLESISEAAEEEKASPVTKVEEVVTSTTASALKDAREMLALAQKEVTDAQKLTEKGKEVDPLAAIKSTLVQEGFKPRTGLFLREVIKRSGSFPSTEHVNKLPPAPVAGSSTQPAVQSVVSDKKEQAEASTALGAVMDMLKGLQGELTSVRGELAGMRQSTNSSGTSFPKRPMLSRYGKKEGLDAYGVHTSNQHHFENPETEKAVDWLGLGDSDAHSSRPERVRALLGSQSVFHNKSGTMDGEDKNTPKEARFEEYLCQLALSWHGILTDGQSSVYSEGDSFYRLIGRYVIAVCVWIMATKRACQLKYSPNLNFSQTWAYINTLVTEEFQGARLDTSNSFHVYLLSLVPEEKLNSLSGLFVLNPSDDVVSAANKAICDRYLRGAGLLDGGLRNNPFTAAGGKRGEEEHKAPKVSTSELTRRPMGHCVICWEPRSVCKGYGSKTGYFCKNKFHKLNKHHNCGFKHVWEEMGGPRSSPCGKDEPWPLDKAIYAALDKKD